MHDEPLDFGRCHWVTLRRGGYSRCPNYAFSSEGLCLYHSDEWRDREAERLGLDEMDEDDTRPEGFDTESMGFQDNPCVITNRRNPDDLKRHRSLNELLAWLQDAVPAVVLKYLIQAQAVKVCSNVSPAFAVIARNNGFEAYQVAVPGHFYNVILTVEGPIKIDLSAIQFRCAPQRKSVRKAILQLITDPWDAVELDWYDGSLEELEPPRIRQDAIPDIIAGYQMALEDVVGLRNSDPEIIEEFKDLYPWFPVELWEAGSNPNIMLDHRTREKRNPRPAMLTYRNLLELPNRLRHRITKYLSEETTLPKKTKTIKRVRAKKRRIKPRKPRTESSKKTEFQKFLEKNDGLNLLRRNPGRARRRAYNRCNECYQLLRGRGSHFCPVAVLFDTKGSVMGSAVDFLTDISADRYEPFQESYEHLLLDATLLYNTKSKALQFLKKVNAAVNSNLHPDRIIYNIKNEYAINLAENRKEKLKAYRNAVNLLIDAYLINIYQKTPAEKLKHLTRWQADCEKLTSFSGLTPRDHEFFRAMRDANIVLDGSDLPILDVKKLFSNKLLEYFDSEQSNTKSRRSRRNPDERLRRIEKQYRQSGDNYEDYANALVRAGILGRLHSEAQIERMRNLLAQAPLYWKPVDDELQRLGWVQLWDEGWESYETQPSAAPTDMAYQHFYRRDGRFNNLWCQHEWRERTHTEDMMDSEWGEKMPHTETWTECAYCHQYRRNPDYATG